MHMPFQQLTEHTQKGDWSVIIGKVFIIIWLGNWHNQRLLPLTRDMASTQRQLKSLVIEGVILAAVWETY